MIKFRISAIAFIVLAGLLAVGCSFAIPTPNNPLKETVGVMNNQVMGKHLAKNHPQFKGEPGYWIKKSSEFKVFIITDESHNRMRVMAPVKKISKDDSELIFTCLEANFDRALDVKYAINDGVLWSAYLHPLESLTLGDLDNAIKQVETLVKNTGTTYTSSELVFKGGNPDEAEPVDQK